MKKIKKINSRKEYEKYIISEDIKWYLWDFTKELFWKIKTLEDLIAVYSIIVFISLFTKNVLKKISWEETTDR